MVLDQDKIRVLRTRTIHGKERKRGTPSNLPLNKGRVTGDQVAAALLEAKGMITQAGRILGVAPQTVRQYIKRYTIAAEALKEAREYQGDLCEMQIFAAIDRGESWAIRLYATTQLRERGYGEKAVETPAQSAAKAGQPKSLSIDYDAYNRSYREALDVLKRGNASGDGGSADPA